MRSRDVEPTVETLLSNIITGQACRNNDKYLLISYWSLEGLILTPEQERIFLSTTPAESITRARRALRGKYPGDKATEDQRYSRFKEERDDHGQDITSIILKGKGTNLRTMLVNGEWITVLDD